MCGIVGVASRVPSTDPEMVLAMRETLTHRGPDDAGIWRSDDGSVELAMRRLAIIDLSPGGHQPMQDAEGEVCVIQNGEIYNYQALRRELEGYGHRFRSASDTEVIAEAYRRWGPACVEHFNGMFALCVYDLREKRLFIARDRAGEKPLFYVHQAGRFVFASELKALMADPAFPRDLDLNALNHYLAFGYVPGDMCILRGVHKLPQGHAMTYDIPRDLLRSWEYWRLPEPRGEQGGDADALLDELEELLLDSVRLRLIADVPIGILLSGGIDSSLVTAMATRVSASRVKTFTVSFPGHGGYDEGPFAKQVASHLGTEHTELVAQPATVGILPELARQYDEPIADSSMVPTYLVSRLIRQHATVALGGDGGDELFGGYPHYNWIQRQEAARHVVPAPLRAWLGAAASRWLPIGMKGRNYVVGFAGDLAMSIAHVNMYFDATARRRLLAPLSGNGSWATASPEAYKARLCGNGHTPLQKATAVDFRTYLVDDILVKVDRASMLTSLEVRAPWLDHRIIEMAFGRVPDVFRAGLAGRKILSRRLAEKFLPKTLDLSRKQGFSLPMRTWFKGAWGQAIEEILYESEAHLFDRRAIESLIAGQHRGYSNAQRLFALAIFELWRREYNVRIPA